MSTISVLLRLVAIVELIGSFVLSGLMINAAPDCSALLSHAPSYSACMSKAASGATVWTAIVMVVGAAIGALILFAIARVVDQTAENGQLLRNIMARQDGAAP